MTDRKLALSILAALLVAALAGAAPARAGGSASEGFQKISSLAGVWEAKDDSGKLQMRTTFRPVAGGSSILETQEAADHADMLTVYHMDGDDLMLTHYCMAGNQPRMKAVAAAGKVVFTFRDATNLASKIDGHMHGLTVTFKDEDHFTQEWVWLENGEEKPSVFNFARVQ